jgi:two-component system, cell cycle response regulator
MPHTDILAGTPINPRVLIVEDDPVSAMVIKRLFRFQNIHADHASDGRQALEMHKSNGYRLVISDWMMPEVSGVDLCREFRAIGGPYVYFVLCSAKGLAADKVEAFDAGVDDFLSKPLDRDELHARLQVARRILGFEEDLHHQKAELELMTRSLSDLNQSLTLASRRFEELFNGLPVACFTFDEHGLVHEWNRGAESVFGIQAFSAFQQPVWELLGKSGPTIWNAERVSQVFSGDSEPVFDWTFQLEDGSTKYLACNVICLRSNSGNPVGAVCANLDVTERATAQRQVAEQKAVLEQMNERLSELAITDGLTGLSNHRRFQEILEQTFEYHVRSKQQFSLILLDIDHFKRINDDFGHQMGDEVLKTFGNILRQCARLHELPARYGGEEFAVILQNCGEEDAVKVAERFRQGVLDADWNRRKITASFGVATWTPEVSTPKELIAHADVALYYSKQTGRDRVTHYRTLVEAAAA